ncbi:helix-turn-helix domain-containing protein [Cohnella fermenti]|uniref:helix-turn-helix domain-containing protein n=1 Tax=Cohnella fermenti TaxID=2565925 RepID=UPI001454E3E3|nr:helix-turn-helix domain-containing protein [Cohnella fermenti]
MHYYRKMFRTFAGIAVIYTILLEIGFISFYWVSFHNKFSESLETTIQQLIEYSDSRLQSPQYIGHMLSISDYTKKYLGQYMTDFERLKFYQYVNGISGITLPPYNDIAVTMITDDYVTMNNMTGSIDFFQSTFHIDDDRLEEVIQVFYDDRILPMQMFSVRDDRDRELYVIARREWLGALQPLYIFSSYYDYQLFNLNALPTGGAFAILYNNKLVASVGEIASVELQDIGAAGLKNSEKEYRMGYSAVSGFSYVYLYEPQSIMSPTLMMIIGISLLALAASIGLMAYITNRMYTPIEGVLQSTGESFTKGDEFAHIRNTIQSLHLDMETMSHSLGEYQISVENKQFRELLLGLIPPERIDEALVPFPQLQVEGPFIAILLKYVDTGQFTTEFLQNIVLDSKQSLQTSLEALFAARRLLRIVDLNFETQVIIVHSEEEQLDLERLRNSIISAEPKLGLEISAIVGSPCSTLHAIPASYRQLVNAADQQLYWNVNSKVIRVKELNAHWTSSVYYPIRVEQSIVNAVVHGKSSVWKAALEELIHTNSMERKTSLLPLARMLEATITRIMDGAGVENLEPIGAEATNPRFRNCQTFGELHHKVEDVLRLFERWFAHEQDKSTTGLASKMLSYIHEHYQSDIGLFDLADHLNLSRNYVSTLFKNTVGRNFKDYIGEFRFQKACKIIKADPDMKIKQISEITGCNTDILTRLFIKHAGMLPTEFQQLMKNGQQKS